MIQAKKVLGQNFLTDQNKIRAIIDSIPNLDNSIVVEVGPGKGAITKPLVSRAKEVIAIEIDEDMINILNESINEDNFTLINEDILNVEWDDVIKGKDNINFVSNLPYYLSSKIMFKVADDARFSTMSVMLQKELVDRIFAKPNSKTYGRLTVAIGSLYTLEKKISVPAGCFTPKPNVDSGFIILKRKEIDFNIGKYLDFIKKCFSAKRKTLLNSLKNGGCNNLDGVKSFLDRNNIKENVRGEELSIETFISMFNEIENG